MAAQVMDQSVTDQYAIYLGDCMPIMVALPAESIHLSIYSPPFAGLFQYSSSDRDLSNSRDYAEFTEHYEHVVREIHRLTMPGRITAVHCMDIPTGNTGRDAYLDFPGDIIRLHDRLGFDFVARRTIWKEPLWVRNRTMVKALAHQTIVNDSAFGGVAAGDYLLAFRKRGDNQVPIAHPIGLTEYAGCHPVPHELLRYRGWTGKQTENRFSHWVWRQYASAVWDDIRGNQGDQRLDQGAVLPFREAKDDEDERHIHPLQLDVIARAVVLWSNPGERVLTPFMGVGSEVYEAVRNGRLGIGAELKPSYYRQAVKNLASLADARHGQESLFLDETPGLSVLDGLGDDGADPDDEPRDATA